MTTRKSHRRQAIEGLRKAYLALDMLYCMNELEKDQKWIEDILQKAKRRIGKALRVLEPKTRLPDIMLDTQMGRDIAAARENLKRARKCKHQWETPKTVLWGRRDDWKTCPKCEMTQWAPPEKKPMKSSPKKR